jgi:hypothetical protein
MDAFTLLLTLALTFAFGVLSARQLLGGVLYLMARNSQTIRQQPSAGGTTAQS